MAPRQVTRPRRCMQTQEADGAVVWTVLGRGRCTRWGLTVFLYAVGDPPSHQPSIFLSTSLIFSLTLYLTSSLIYCTLFISSHTSSLANTAHLLSHLSPPHHRQWSPVSSLIHNITHLFSHPHQLKSSLSPTHPPSTHTTHLLSQPTIPRLFFTVQEQNVGCGGVVCSSKWSPSRLNSCVKEQESGVMIACLPSLRTPPPPPSSCTFTHLLTHSLPPSRTLP